MYKRKLQFDTPNSKKQQALKSLRVTESQIRRLLGVSTPSGKRQRMGHRAVVNRSQGGDYCEGKWIDIFVNSFSLGTVGQLALDSAVKMNQGTDASTRIGRKITGKTFQIKGEVKNNSGPSSTTFADSVNVWVVLDRDPTPGVAVNWSDVFVGLNPGMAFVNLNETHRFRILKQIEVIMKPMPYVDHSGLPPGTEASLATRDYEDFEWFGDLKSLQIGYGGNAGTVADLTSNNILVFASASNCANYFMTFQTRVRYTDD